MSSLFHHLLTVISPWSNVSSPQHLPDTPSTQHQTDTPSPQYQTDTPSSQHRPEARAFTALLEADARWQDFEQMSAQAPLSPSSVLEYAEHADPTLPKSASLAFIITCPYVDVPSIPEDERNCPVCTEPYHRLKDRARNCELKVAQRLPCGHQLCDHCIFKWLSPFEQSNNNTCPFDRRVLFPKLPHFLDTEGIQERLDLVDWTIEARGRQPVGAERDLIRKLKVLLVERRLEEAVEELETDILEADTLIQSRLNAEEIDEADAFAYRGKLVRFDFRLTIIAAFAESMEPDGISRLEARLQDMTERLARDRANVREIWDAVS